MSQKLLSIIIIHYRTKHYLKTCLDSLLAQTYDPIEILFINNNSGDDSVEYVMKYEEGNFSALQISLISNKENLGYAGAANQGISLAKGDYVVITNPDIIFEPDYFEKTIARMEQDTKIAALTGKIKKFNFEAAGIKPGEISENPKLEAGKTNLIDTAGLFCYPDRRVIDDGQGLEDNGQFDEEKEVFGISGACPLYRREALEDVEIGNEYLDNDFFMYKEDVDLSWRFLLFGWKCLYHPEAVAWHGRGTGVEQRFSTSQLLKNRGKSSKFQKFFGLKNQRLMQVKNEIPKNLLKDLWPIFKKEILTFGYVLFREPYLLKSYFKFLQQLPRALQKRKTIMRRKRVTAEEMEKWFSENQSKYFK